MECPSTLGKGSTSWVINISGKDLPLKACCQRSELPSPTSACRVAGDHEICFEKLTSTSPAADNCT